LNITQYSEDCNLEILALPRENMCLQGFFESDALALGKLADFVVGFVFKY